MAEKKSVEVSSKKKIRNTLHVRYIKNFSLELCPNSRPEISFLAVGSWDTDRITHRMYFFPSGKHERKQASSSLHFRAMGLAIELFGRYSS